MKRIIFFLLVLFDISWEYLKSQMNFWKKGKKSNELFKVSSLKSIWNYIEYFKWKIVNTITTSLSDHIIIY